MEARPGTCATFPTAAQHAVAADGSASVAFGSLFRPQLNGATFAAEFRLSENENESLSVTRHVAAWPLQAVTPWLGASPGGSRARFSEAVRFAVVTERGSRIAALSTEPAALHLSAGYDRYLASRSSKSHAR